MVKWRFWENVFLRRIFVFSLKPEMEAGCINQQDFLIASSISM